MNQIKIHPNAPPKLVKKFRKCGSFHKLADEIEVNVKFVYELITKGIEPTDRTPRGREIRHRLYLRKYKPRNRPPQPPKPKEYIWWNNLGPAKRLKHIKATYEKEHRS